MNESIAIPISGPLANENTRIKSFRYKPFFNIDGKNTIQTKQSINIACICDFCLYFSVFLFIFITLLLFTVVNFQDQMEMDDQAADKIWFYSAQQIFANLGKYQLGRIVFLRISPNFQKSNLTKIDQDKNQSSNKHQEVILHSDHFSKRRILMLVEDNAIFISLNKAT